MKKAKWALVAAAGTALALGPAWAADDARTPRLSGAVSLELQDDWTFASEDDEAETNDLFATLEPSVTVHVVPGLSFQAGFVLEPVDDAGPGEDRFFGDFSGFVETVTLSYATDRFSLYGGKYNPPFGVAWDRTPGIYGADFAEDYELAERIGVGGSLTFAPASGGSHVVSANAFFVDTTLLSEAAPEGRGRTSRDDGGVANTEDLSSFSLTVDGGEMPAAPALRYHLGLSRQEGGRGDPRDEFGVAAALYGAIDLSDALTLEPLVEAAHVENAEGARQDRDYVTVGATLGRGPYSLALSYTGRFTDVDGGGDTEDHLVQISAGYAFAFGLSVEAGYKLAEEDGIASHTAGILLSYGIDF